MAHQDRSHMRSPVMDSEADLLGDSPAGSPTIFAKRRSDLEKQHDHEKNEKQQHEKQQPAASENDYVPPASAAADDDNNNTADDDGDAPQHKSGGGGGNLTPPRAATRSSINGEDMDDEDEPITNAGAGAGAADDTRTKLIAAGQQQSSSGGDESPSKRQYGSAEDDLQQNFSDATAGPLGEPPSPTHHVSRQLASDAFESLNYDEIENVPLQEERHKRGGDLDPASWKVWIILALCGALTGIIAFGIDRGQKALSILKFKAVEYFLKSENPAGNWTAAGGNVTTAANDSSSGFFFAAGGDGTSTTAATMLNGTTTSAAPSGENWHYDPRSLTWAFVVFLAINFAYVSVAAAVVVLGEPVAKGSGIPEVKCYLNGVRIWRVVRLKTMLVKATGILFAVASGLPVGKEGPMIHSGSAIASGISAGKSSLLKWDTGFFREFRTDAYKRAFITAGAAAGVGAAFGAPVGGIIFAVEEVCSFWNLELTVMVFLCAAVSPMVLQILMHPTGLETGKVNGLIDFGLVSGSYSYREIPLLILLGCMSGGLGAIFIWMNMVVTRWRKAHVTTKPRKFLEVVGISLAVSIVLISLVLWGYDCVDIEGSNENTRAQMKTYGCGPGKFNDMATYFFVDLEDSINLLIHEPRAIKLGTLAKQYFPYFILTTITYGINVPSGLFLPSLALGSNFGHMFAQVVNIIAGDDKFVDPAKFALYGGTGMLAGNLRMTISVVAIVMEATGNATLFYPLAIITIGAKFFGDLFNHGIFDEHIDMAHIPLLMTKNPQAEIALLTAADIMNKHPVRLPPECTVRTLIHVLKHYPLHNVFMVVDENTGVFRGMLLRRTALILIDKEAWRRRLEFDDFARTEKERKYVSVKKYGVLERPEPEDYDGMIDVLRYADQWPHVFSTTTPVPRLYRTFRELGLRHIIIVDERHRPVGLIGRRQLCFLEIKADTGDHQVMTSDRSMASKHNTDESEDETATTPTGQKMPASRRPYAQANPAPQAIATGALPAHIADGSVNIYPRERNDMLPLRDRDVRRSRLSNAPWIDTALEESTTPIK